MAVITYKVVELQALIKQHTLSLNADINRIQARIGDIPGIDLIEDDE